MQTKNLPWEGYGYFLEPHNDTLVVGKIRVAGKRDLGQGAQEGGPPGGRTDQVVPGVATLG